MRKNVAVYTVNYSSERGRALENVPPHGDGEFECLWGAFPSTRRRGTFSSSPRGNSLTWNWFIVKEIESVLSNNWRGNCGGLLWFRMVFYGRRKGNLFWLSLERSNQIESINFILLSLIQLFLELLNIVIFLEKINISFSIIFNYFYNSTLIFHSCCCYLEYIKEYIL